MSELLEEESTTLPSTNLAYLLRAKGVVGDWLVLGPLTRPYAGDAQGDADRQQILAMAFGEDAEEFSTPSERATATILIATDSGVGNVFADGERDKDERADSEHADSEHANGQVEGMWRVVNTLDDGFVDLAQRAHTPQIVCAWGYAQVVLPHNTSTQLLLTTASPTNVWVNGELVFSYADLPDRPTQLLVSAILLEGTNEILIRTANLGQGDLPLGFGLSLPTVKDASTEGAGKVILPTLLEPVSRRNKLALVMGHAYLEQDVYSQEQRIILRWPRDMQMIDALNTRLQTPAGRIYAEANPMIQRGMEVDFGHAQKYPDGIYEILIQPQFEEYYVQQMRVQRRIPFQVRNGQWSLLYYGDLAGRQREALEDAAKRRDLLYAEIAKSALGQWDSLRHEVIEQAIAQIATRSLGYEAWLLALLGWVTRLGDLADFPQEVAWLLEEQATLVLGALDDEPHVDAMPISLLVSHLLAGQLYPQRDFADLNAGDVHQAQAEQLLLVWMRAVAQTGFSTGESEARYAETIAAMSYLVDLALTDEVAEMAAALLDKLAYQMALQTFVGAWGGSQEEATARTVGNARLGPLSGVARVWWGQGIFNADCAATVALACCVNYLLPEIIAAVGLDRQQDSWLRRTDLHKGQAVLRTAYRTGDYLLASLFGKWPNAEEESSARSLLWQVTMGPDAVILGNRPALNSEHAAWTESYWLGNAATVCTVQWRDVLVVGYGSAHKPALDFTHARFPRASFDEVRLGDGWVMARKGNGYVALTATGGVEVVTSGRTVHLEVRAAAESVWLVQMGRGATDGTFAEFAERVLALSLTLARDSLRYVSLRGEEIVFDANAPVRKALLVDGVAVHEGEFPHVESIYGGAETLPANQVEIRYQEHRMLLDFDTPGLPIL